MSRDLLLRANAVLERVETLYHKHHPRSLWFMGIIILLTTHYAASIGTRPILILVYIFLGLHANDLLKDRPSFENDLCEATQLALRCYDIVLKLHQYLLSSKTQKNNTYIVMLSILAIFPIIIIMKITSFHECYSVAIILCILLQYKYRFHFTDQKGNLCNLFLAILQSFFTFRESTGEFVRESNVKEFTFKFPSCSTWK